MHIEHFSSKKKFLTKENRNQVTGSLRKETPQPMFHIGQIIYTLPDLSLKRNTKYSSRTFLW